MSNDEFTPTEWEVQEQYAAGNIHAEAEFDRMIAEVERKAAQKGWVRGFDAGWTECSDPRRVRE